MPNSKKKITHKFGANRRELAHKVQKLDSNFAQSRDIHEDRGERQIKQIFTHRLFRYE